MLSSIFSSIYNYISKSRVDLHVNQPFSDVFFDKFKNLLDDYIVNYQVKYFFYLLFISFFYLELSEGLFQLLHNYSPYHLSISGIFVIDFCSFLFNIGIIDFAYLFFSFNLDIIGLFVSLVGNNSIGSLVLVFGTLVSVLAYEYELINRNYIYLQTMFVIYLTSSFVLFFFYYFGIFSFNTIFYAILFIFALSGFSIKEWNIYSSTALVISFVLILLPYHVAGCALFVFTFFYIPIISYKPVIRVQLSQLGDLFILYLLTYYIFPLHYAHSSSILFVLNIIPFFLYFIYVYIGKPQKNDVSASVNS